MELEVIQGLTGRREELASCSSDDLGGSFQAYSFRIIVDAEQDRTGSRGVVFISHWIKRWSG